MSHWAEVTEGSVALPHDPGQNWQIVTLDIELCCLIYIFEEGKEERK